MQDTVSFARVASYDSAALDDAILALFAQMPVAQTICADSKILLKPNLLAKHPAEHAVTTHPMVLRAVIRACKHYGARAEHITVADSAGGLYNPAQTKIFYRTCGFTAVCEEEGAVLYTACESVKKAVADGKVVTEFELITPVVEADLIINLPKLKTHVMTGLTAATKNLFGTIPGLKKAEWHTRFPDKERFGEMLIDLYQTVAPSIHILDGIVGMEGDGPAGGTPRALGMIFASENALNLDLAAASLIGLAPMRVPYLVAAHGRGLCADAFDLTTLQEVSSADAPAQTQQTAWGAVQAEGCAENAEDATKTAQENGGKQGNYANDANNAPCVTKEGVVPFVPVADWKLPESYLGGGDGDVDFAARVPKFVRPLVENLQKQVAPHPVVLHNLCIGCGKCAEICPQHTITVQKRKATIHKKDCIRCFCCHEMCPVKAIAVKKFDLFGL